MPFTFDATVGGADANSYVEVAQADDYFAGRLNVTAWPLTSLGVDLDLKQRALAMSTARIDQELFDGEKAEWDQRLKFPRIGIFDESGHPFDGDIIPLIVEQATYEEALWLLQAGTQDATGLSGLELFKRIKAGTVELEMFDQSMLSDALKSGLAPQAVRLLAPVMITYDVPDPTFGTARLRRS